MAQAVTGDAKGNHIGTMAKRAAPAAAPATASAAASAAARFPSRRPQPQHGLDFGLLGERLKQERFAVRASNYKY